MRICAVLLGVVFVWGCSVRPDPNSAITETQQMELRQMIDEYGYSPGFVGAVMDVMDEGEVTVEELEELRKATKALDMICTMNIGHADLRFGGYPHNITVEYNGEVENLAEKRKARMAAVTADLEARLKQLQAEVDAHSRAREDDSDLRVRLTEP